MIKILIGLILLSTSAFSWFLPYKNPNKLNYPEFVDLDSKIVGAWNSYKDEYVESNGLIFKDYDANYTNKINYQSSDSYKYSVSEGIGYVMLIALYMNDQQTFNKVYNAGKSHFGFPSLNSPSWLVKYNASNVNSVSQGPNGQGSATDADFDVAAALVFASVLAEKGFWSDNNYKNDANTLINAMYDKDRNSSNYMKLGTNWGGTDQQNLSYFAPAYMRLFDEWQGKSRWSSVISNHYNTLKKNPGYSKGIIRNWCTSTGGDFTPTGTGSDQSSDKMAFEAIRVPWRIGVDAIWYGSTESKSYCDNAMNFAPDAVELGTGMFLAVSPYTMQQDKNWLKSTPRAMWGSCAAYKGGDLLNNYASALSSTYNSYSKLFNEDNQYYFATLTLLGALVNSGSFPNIYDDLKSYSEPTDKEIFKFSSNAVKDGGDLDMTINEQPYFFAKLIESGDWEILLKSSKNGAEFTASGSGSTPYFLWNKIRDGNKLISVGETINATLKFNGSVISAFSFIIKKLPLDFTEVMIDNFNEENMVHELGGTWNVFTNDGSSLDVSFENDGDYDGVMKVDYTLNSNNDENVIAAIEARFDNVTRNFVQTSYFRFFHKGDAARLEFLQNGDDHYSSQLGVDIEAHEEWTSLYYTNRYFEKIDSDVISLDVLSSVASIRFTALGNVNTSGTFYIDDLLLNGSYTDGPDEVEPLEIKSNKKLNDENVFIYPNPFNPLVNIVFNGLENSNVNALVYDINGKVVCSLFYGLMPESTYSVVWDGSNFDSGVYFLQVNSNNKTYSKRLVLIK